MRHNQNNNSTANHGSQKPGHMHYQYGRNDLPNPQKPAKRSVLNKIRERFQEKPATAEEVKQLGLNAQRETYKTRIKKAKEARGSRFDSLTGGGSPSYRRSSSRAPPQTGSWLLDSGNSRGGSFMDMDSGPSLDFITGADSRSRGRKQDSGFGKGLSDLF